MCPSCGLDRKTVKPNLVLVSFRPNPNLYPEGGYIFVESDGTRFRGESWKDLIAKVAEYRARNGREKGDPEAEIFTQYCVRMPSHCGMHTTHQTIVPHSMTFNQKVLQWFSNLLEWKRRNPIARVTDGEAARRAAICARCPMQRSLVESCESCIKTIRHGRLTVLDGHASQHQNLQPCAALGEDCMVSVHIEQPQVPAEQVPAECWRKG